MKLTHIILILSLFFTSCAPVIKPHGYQLEDILLNEPQTIGTSTKEDLEDSYGSPSIKIEDVGNTWIYLATSKQKKVFTKDEFLDQLIFTFNFDENNILISQEVYDQNHMLSFKSDSNKTYDYGTNYTILDQLYDAFTLGL
jgi:outer membrane protein assembly factor BamE (lipoprotein component of BamABCDE complex)